MIHAEDAIKNELYLGNYSSDSGYFISIFFLIFPTIKDKKKFNEIPQLLHITKINENPQLLYITKINTPIPQEVQAGKPKLLECCLTGLSDLLSNHELKVFVQTDKGDWRRNIYNALKAVAMATDIGRVHTAFRGKHRVSLKSGHALGCSETIQTIKTLKNM